MADPKFFTNAGPFSLQQIAECAGCALPSGASPDHMISDVAPLDQADSAALSFLDNVKYKVQFQETEAGACFVTKGMADFAPKATIALITDNPHKAYALAAQMFYPPIERLTQISDQAHISSSAKIGKGAYIEAGVHIGDHVQIGQNCIIEANTVIRENVQIGEYARIGSSATISHAIIGAYVRIYPGVRIGQDGFGFAIDPAGHVKVPQLGRVIIEDHVEIGANTCIDRGAGPDTLIGQGTWIDNLVQIGHNVKIGKGCVIVAQVGIAGSTALEDYVVAAGQVGIAGHLTIGTGAKIAAQSGVTRDIPAGEEHMGYPSMPIKQFLRQHVTLKSLINKGKNT